MTGIDFCPFVFPIWGLWHRAGGLPNGGGGQCLWAGCLARLTGEVSRVPEPAWASYKAGHIAFKINLPRGYLVRPQRKDTFFCSLETEGPEVSTGSI